VDATIGILGQAILILVGLALVVAIIFFVLVIVRAIIRRGIVKFCGSPVRA